MCFIHIAEIAIVSSVLNNCVCFEENVVKLNGDKKTSNLIDSDYLNSDYEASEDKWLGNALRDVAYYLRNHKFNEWDRRRFTNEPSVSIGFYNAFPSPSLNSIYWVVHKSCHQGFFQCVTYLHSIVKIAPFTRNDDITTSLNKAAAAINISLQNQDKECKKALSYAEKTGLPFGEPEEKFHWRTSASYYMCWYTMKRIPALAMLGEFCDNFANCLDKAHGSRNYDPRSDDKLSFACATYSFCPDPCCPLKYVKTLSECYDNVDNPCYNENFLSQDKKHRRCVFNPLENQDLDQIIQNRWNVSCYCQQKGFTWDSQFGMCVDINECMTKEHSCDKNSEDCLNIPGTFQCVCKWGYIYDNILKKCIRKPILKVPMQEEANNKLSFMETSTAGLFCS